MLVNRQSILHRQRKMRVAILSGVLFFSGIGALIFETLWLRLSGLAFGNSVWAAALILSSFMAGLALGNAIAASSKLRRWRPLHLFRPTVLLPALDERIDHITDGIEPLTDFIRSACPTPAGMTRPFTALPRPTWEPLLPFIVSVRPR
jgi:hypothetical protein